MALVLIVDDDPVVRDLVRAVLTRLGAQVIEAANLASGHVALRSGVDLLISDLGLPDGEGTELLHAADRLGVPHICMSARLGTKPPVATRFLRKPVPLSRLADMVRPLLPQTVRPKPVVPQDHTRHLSALASAREAMARCQPGTLPLRQVIVRFMNVPEVRFVGLYEASGDLPTAMDWAGRGLDPRQVESFFGRADLLSDAMAEPEVAVELPGDLVPAAQCQRLLVLPLVYASDVIGAAAFGSDQPLDRAFCKAMAAQLVSMVMVLRVHAWVNHDVTLSMP